MGKTIQIFKGSTGLNNKVTPTRIRFNPESGITELSKGINVDLDRTGRITRRDGYTQKLSGAYHSLHSCGEYALCVTGNALTVLESDYSTTAIRNLTQNVRVRYKTVNEVTYYLNGFERGKVIERVSYGWNAGTYVGPDTVKELSNPPTGHLLEIHSGRMYIGQDNVLWFSEPFAFSNFDLARNFIPFDSRLKMIKSVDDGIFISDSNNTYFLDGTDPERFKLKLVAASPAIEGTESNIPRQLMGEMFYADYPAIWVGVEGVHMGFPGGKVFNLSDEKLNIPNAFNKRGTCYYNKDGKLIISLET